MNDEQLIALAGEARRHAHAPYSHFAVGAAVTTASGKTFAGTNVENASYGLSVCAERVAMWKAVSDGERGFVSIAVVTENGATPCGACRQVMAEFGDRDLRVLVADTQGHCSVHTLGDLLPDAFTPQKLAEAAKGRPHKAPRRRPAGV